MTGRRKYNAKKTVVDGITFDSKHEAQRYKELKLLERAGVISDLQLQVPYDLIPPQYEVYERYSSKTGKRLKDGKRLLEKGVKYNADFVYTDKGGIIHVEDAKGMRTTDYILKRKLMLHFHGIRLEEV